MATSIRDVARLAGVSASTVSKALTGRHSIDTRTKQRVLEAVKLTDYSPSGFARALALGKTETVGVYYNHGSLPGSLVGIMLEGAQQCLGPAGYQLMLVARSPEQDEIAKPFRQKLIDGTIIAHDRDFPLERFLEGAGIPYVLVNVEPTDNQDCVVTDNKGGIRLAVDHLVQLGHTRIAFINGVEGSHVATRLRADGYIEAMSFCGLPAIPGYNVCGPIEQQCRRLLELPELPTAVICYNDEVAMGMIGQLLERGVSVPQQVSVIGCDDHNVAVRYFHPAVTTLRVPFKMMGQRAAQLLLLRLEKRDRPYQLEVLPHELIVRQSTGPVARREG